MALQCVERKHGQNLQLVYAADSEGNSFSPVEFDPCVGYFCGGEFEDLDSESDSPRFLGVEVEVNAVCIN